MVVLSLSEGLELDETIEKQLESKVSLFKAGTLDDEVDLFLVKNGQKFRSTTKYLFQESRKKR
jgi:hypothetical protein